MNRRRPTRRSASALVLVCTVATLLVATAATARPPSRPAALSRADFREIVLDPASEAGSAVGSASAPAAGRTPTDRPIADFADEAPAVGSRPTPEQSNVARIVLKQPKLVFHSTGRHASGSASWYCQTGVSACHGAHPGGMYAAAGAELRVGSWRGRVVRVCAGGDCILVRLIDWCACGGSHVIDLYSDAFRQLAPLSAGVQRVTVSW